MVGTCGKLYQSFKSLSDVYMEPNINKDILLKSSCSIGSWYDTFFSPTNSGTTINKKTLPIYGYCVSTLSDEMTSPCYLVCVDIMSKKVASVSLPIYRVGGSLNGGGFVKGVVKYMIMDDLEVNPMSTIYSISVLNKFNIMDVSAEKERSALVGTNEIRGDDF